MHVQLVSIVLSRVEKFHVATVSEQEVTKLQRKAQPHVGQKCELFTHFANRRQKSKFNATNVKIYV